MRARPITAMLLRKELLCIRTKSVPPATDPYRGRPHSIRSLRRIRRNIESCSSCTELASSSANCRSRPLSAVSARDVLSRFSLCLTQQYFCLTAEENLLTENSSSYKLPGHLPLADCVADALWQAFCAKGLVPRFYKDNLIPITQLETHYVVPVHAHHGYQAEVSSAEVFRQI